MAIQMRRGAYEDFEPGRMVPGEWAVVLSGDPGTASGRALYHCFAPGVVEMVPTGIGLVEAIYNNVPYVIDALTTEVAEAESHRAGAEIARANAEASRAQAESARVAAESARVSAEASRVAAQAANNSAQAANGTEQAKNNADQALNNQMAARQVFVELESGEYDPDTLKPTIQDAQPGVIYLVPTDDTGKGSLDWRWTGADFEPVGGYKFRIGYHVVNDDGYISIIEEG